MVASRVVLALDNSLDFLNIALAVEDKLIEERHIRSGKHPSQIIPGHVVQLLSSNGYTIKDISLIVVSLGPGSFTGIRVGLAFCKGISLGGDIPVVGVPTLDVLVSPFAFMEGYYLCPLLDAKKGEVFSALYHVSRGAIGRRTDYGSFKPREIVNLVKTPCICFGTGIGLTETILSEMDGVITIKDHFHRISGEALIKTGLSAVEPGEHTTRPIYGRRSEAEIKFNVSVV